MFTVMVTQYCVAPSYPVTAIILLAVYVHAISCYNISIFDGSYTIYRNTQLTSSNHGLYYIEQTTSDVAECGKRCAKDPICYVAVFIVSLLKKTG